MVELPALQSSPTYNGETLSVQVRASRGAPELLDVSAVVLAGMSRNESEDESVPTRVAFQSDNKKQIK
jgi:hypothetical protein